MKVLASSPAGRFKNEEILEALADVAAPDTFLKTTKFESGSNPVDCV
jgi:hypothetical protein